MYFDERKHFTSRILEVKANYRRLFISKVEESVRWIKWLFESSVPKTGFVVNYLISAILIKSTSLKSLDWFKPTCLSKEQSPSQPLATVRFDITGERNLCQNVFRRVSENTIISYFPFFSYM